MATDQATTPDQAARAAKPGARVFTVRLWREELGDRSEYRGSVRDAATDAFRGFQEWSDLVAFMVARIEQEDGRRVGRRKEARDVSR